MRRCNFKKKSTALTIGKFGVLHKGHQAMLTKLEEISKQEGLQPIIFSFYPSPALFFSQNHMRHGRIFSFKLIYKILQKQFNESFGFLLKKFDMQFSQIEPKKFIKFLAHTLNVKHLIVGENFYFGKDRSGNIDTLKILCEHYKIKLTIQKLILLKHEKQLSTTQLRNWLLNGEVENFNSHLAFNQKYKIIGRVLHGQKLGAKIGFKTANVHISSKIITPKFGVYACEVYFKNHQIKGIVNIGIKPTVQNKNSPMAEVHLFDFDKNIYDKEIEIELLHFIREERKFASIKELTNQIKSDIVKCKAIMK
jgi:riboflavin kinase / FMN adenylyltransferase